MKNPSFTIKSLAATVLAVVMTVLSVFTASAEGENPSFWVDDSTGEFTVTYHNTVWQSSPVIGGFDDTASGEVRTDGRSLLIIEYLDSENVINKVNSFTEASIRVKHIDNGCVFIVDFSEIGIMIPLQVIADKNGLTAIVDSSQIKEKKKNKLLSVAMLPFFGAGKVGEEGYLLIPDGCGAVVNFASPTDAMTKTYSKQVYGDDAVLYKRTDEISEEQIYLPAYGIKKGNASCLAIITAGDAISTLNVNCESSYYTAYASFDYRQHDESHLLEGSSKEKIVEVVPRTVTKSDFVIKYCFEDNGNYISMAKILHNYLIKNRKIKKSNCDGTTLDLNYTATAQVSKSFLGIPYTGTQLLTDFDDIQKTVEKLNKAKITNYSISVAGALGDGVFGKTENKVKFNSKVGTKKEYKNLAADALKNKGKVYLANNILNVYKSGNGISFASGTARNVSGGICTVYEYYPESFGQNESKTHKLINAYSLDKLGDKFSKSADKIGADISLGQSATLLYGDYHLNDVYDRAEMVKFICNSMKKIKNSANALNLDGANYYALPYADIVSGAPLKSSQYDIFTCDVPFYEAVIRGVCDYSGAQVNLSGDCEGAVLKSVEFGAALRFDLIGKDSKYIADTSATNLYASSNNDWIGSCIKDAKRLKKFYSKNKNAAITEHIEVAPNVYKTVYSNGNYSLVNYTDKDVLIGDTKVAHNDYKLVLTEG